MQELDKSLSLTKETIDTLNVSDQKRYCLNCNTALTDIYCPHCGQKDTPKRQTLSELIFNFISSFSGYESKFFKTCRYLLLRPGFLTLEYNAGRRESYFHPARMYVFISFIYFFLFTSLPEAGEGNFNINVTDNDKNVDIGPLVDYKLETREQYDSVQSLLSPEKRDGWLVQKLKYREIELREKFKGNPREFTSHAIDTFTANFSGVFFVLLPVFAFVLWLLYMGKDFFYSEHLVFSIWYYNFFFLVGALEMLTAVVPWLTWATVLFDGAILVYLLLAMKRVYSQSWRKTFLKYVVFLSLFGICIMLGLFINLLITLMYI